MKGYVQIYTGDGKGKTTASFGLAVRAAGAGMKVFIGQFVKGMKYSELNTLEKIENITIEQFGNECFIRKSPTEADIERARNGFQRMKTIVKSGEFDVVICDEINIALFFKLIDLEEVIDMIQSKPGHVELVLTGRRMPDELLELADLVTEMKEIKHYYSQGVEARKGIES